MEKIDGVFEDLFSYELWQSTYKDPKDESIYDTWRRIAKKVASTEEDKQLWEDRFYDLLEDFKITVGGRIYANAGGSFENKTTLINCFVAPRESNDLDSIEGIYRTLLEQSLTLKSEGGWGCNFSFIRPRGAFIHGIGVESPGSVKYMQLFNTSSDIITAGSGKVSKNGKQKIRKGAMMSVLDCWHPDIEEFITAKQKQGMLDKFNISVGCYDDFMDLICKIERYKEQGKDYSKIDKWNLIFPDTTHKAYRKEWDGNIYKWQQNGYPVEIHKTIKASELWESIMQSTYNRNDPGVLFLDRANLTHCWNYDENGWINTTNPCVAKNTLVNTPNGYKEVQDIQEGDLISTVLGSEPVSKIEIHKDYPVYKIEFSDGNEQIVTGAHQYHVFKKGSKSKKVELVQVKNLSIGDKVRINRSYFEDDGVEFDENQYLKGAQAGVLIGDGCYTEKVINKNIVKIASSQDDNRFNENIKNYIFSDFTFNKNDIDQNSKSMSMILRMKKEDILNLGLTRNIVMKNQ